MSAGAAADPRRVAALFDALAELDPAEAERRLAEEHGDDPALRRAVSELLGSDRQVDAGFLAPRPALLAGALRGFPPAEGAPPEDASAEAGDEVPIAGSPRLGRYYVLHKLAEGGMGVVYVGYDDALHRRVALKVLRRGAAAREWLLREGQALGRLSHPNVVAVHEVGEQAGRVFLAMELVEGPTLRRWCDEARRPFGEVLQLFLQAGRGLAAAHRAGLVHRDFKPDNVLIGADGRARVVDFGIVARDETAPAEAPAPLPTDDESTGGERAPDAGPLSSPLTETGALMGTPAFMSPEQFRGERATPLSDQFSFCVALYRAAYGAAPYPAAELPQLAHSVLHDPPAPPPRRPEVPAWLAPILLRGLHGEAAQRFPSMEELLGAIEGRLPRDPELDPLLVFHERRLLSGVFIAGYVLTSALLLSEACARVLLRPAGLLAVPAILVLSILGVIAGGLRGLSRNRYGRRLSRIFVSLPLALLLHRLIALRFGLSADQILVEDMVLSATAWLLLSQTFERWFRWLALISAVPAVLAAFLPAQVRLLTGLLGLAGVAAMLLRLYVDRDLRPEATVGPLEAAREARPRQAAR